MGLLRLLLLLSNITVLPCCMGKAVILRLHVGLVNIMLGCQRVLKLIFNSLFDLMWQLGCVAVAGSVLNSSPVIVIQHYSCYLFVWTGQEHCAAGQQKIRLTLT